MLPMFSVSKIKSCHPRLCGMILVGSRKFSSNFSELVTKDSKPCGIERHQIITVDNPSMAEQAAMRILEETIVGFDTEWTPQFTSVKWPNSPHLIQIATNNLVYLFHTKTCFQSKAQATSVLSSFLDNERIVKVVFETGNDEKQLLENFNVKCRGMKDLGRLLAPSSRFTLGLQDASEAYLGVQLRKDKRIRMSDWGKSSSLYSDKMRFYAANDAYMALLVYHAWVEGGKVVKRIPRHEVLEEQHLQMLEAARLKREAKLAMWAQQTCETPTKSIPEAKMEQKAVGVQHQKGKGSRSQVVDTRSAHVPNDRTTTKKK